jgi:hypothetical protein
MTNEELSLDELRRRVWLAKLQRSTLRSIREHAQEILDFNSGHIPYLWLSRETLEETLAEEIALRLKHGSTT